MIEVAHRGASRWRTENTIPAFDLAFKKGVRWIEFDVRLSKDGIPMILHDRSFLRTFGKRGYIDKTDSKRAAAIGVPALEDVLGRYRRKGFFYIEIKPVRNKRQRRILIEETYRVIEKTGVGKRSILVSFDRDILLAYRRYEIRKLKSTPIPLGLNAEKISFLKHSLSSFGCIGISANLLKILYKKEIMPELGRKKKIFVWGMKNLKEVRKILPLDGIYGIVHDEPGYLGGKV